ncbi:GNAT family N-acetyltransferase [Methylonatrum kenyense]|uniref:GNAT family N-acetyltransferase n=1 Tax=Methylonatrum kenyense TaxID=455253 RepID=UPI0020BE2619|nr:GNAT family N-acetyltransferase [Methylonatrum kenyense]MCK8515587.1 GNAT family N-acetyltransferase [Methylonatrum kenyense]
MAIPTGRCLIACAVRHAMDNRTGICISSSTTPSFREQQELLVIAHTDAPGWPSLLPARQPMRSLSRILSPLPRTADVRLTAWSESRLIGLLLAETDPAPKVGLARLWRSLWLPPARLPASLRRLLDSPAYARPPGRQGYVSALAVDPRWRGQRIGMSLVRALREQYPALAWVAHVDHPESHALFTHAGFEQTAQTEVEGLVIRTLQGHGRSCQAPRNSCLRKKAGGLLPRTAGQ